jgi:hypothetical protein
MSINECQKDLQATQHIIYLVYEQAWLQMSSGHSPSNMVIVIILDYFRHKPIYYYSEHAVMLQ